MAIFGENLPRFGEKINFIIDHILQMPKHLFVCKLMNITNSIDIIAICQKTSLMAINWSQTHTNFFTVLIASEYEKVF